MSTKINVNPILKNENINPIVFEYKTNSFGNLIDESLAGLLVDKVKRLDISGEVKMHDMVLKIFFDLTFDYKTVCARCDCELNSSLNISEQKVITLSIDEDNGYETDSFAAENGILILDDFILEILSLALPYKELCKEECKGLCSVCGTDLNRNECECNKKKVNSDFKILDNLFNDENKKEVYTDGSSKEEGVESKT